MINKYENTEMKYFHVHEYLGVAKACVKGGTGTFFKAKCKLCQKTVELPTYKIRVNKGCGCIIHRPKSNKNKEAIKKANTKHGMCDSPEYRTWRATKQRCRYPKHKSYSDYGGRGIDMCDAWFDSFEQFYKDMGKRPEGTTINRINNDKGYSLENCEWSTPKQQANNRRNRYE